MLPLSSPVPDIGQWQIMLIVHGESSQYNSAFSHWGPGGVVIIIEWVIGNLGSPLRSRFSTFLALTRFSVLFVHYPNHQGKCFSFQILVL